MKKIIFSSITLFSLWFLPFIANAQIYTYEDMPQDVKDKMNLNKQNGLSSWSEVLFNFNVTVAGLEKEEQTILLERAAKISAIKSVVFQDDNHVMVQCEGGTNFDRVKSIFSSLVSNISKVENFGSLKRTDR